MRVNNIERIGQLLKSKVIERVHSGNHRVEDFFLVEILERRKDKPDLSKNFHLIDVFYLKGQAHLEQKRDEIVEICERNNARAYIRLNIRSEKRVALETLKIISSHIAAEQYNIKNSYLSAARQFHDDKQKTWLVDVDDHDLGKRIRIKEYIDNLIEPFSDKSKIVEIFETLNGYHLITTPFRIDKFKLKYPDVEVKKDSPTILYIP